MGFSSFSALQEAQKRESGSVWLALITFSHPTLADSIRLVSPRIAPITSLGRVFSPARFDVILTPEQFDQPSRATLSIDSTDGTLLTALRSIPSPPPTISIEVIQEEFPDVIEVSQPDFEAESLSVQGISSISMDLIASRFLSLPFPGFNMDRRRVPGIFAKP